MTNVREASRPAAPRGRTDDSSTSPERKLALSSLVRRTLLSFNERSHQRRMLINVLILAQALLIVATAPGYVDGHLDVVAIATVGFGLLVCLVASIFNQALRNSVRAAYVLVIGGEVAALALVFLAAANGNTVEAAYASLLLVPVILEAGLLFAPEVALITTGMAVALTAVALLLALSLGSDASQREVYSLVVDTLGLQTVVGLIAWLLAQFIYDSAVAAQRAEELQFAQARLEALTAQSAEQHHRLEGGVATLQHTIGRVATGELSARASVPEGPLSGLAASVNMLIERLDAVSHGEGSRSRAESGAPLIDVVGRTPEGVTPPPTTLPVMTEDGLSAAASQVQANAARRLQRVQELAAEMVGALAHSQSGLSTTAQTASETLRTVGASIAAADGLLSAAQREVELVGRLRRALAGVRPGDAASLAALGTDVHEAAALGPGEAAALLGLGPDLGVGAPGFTGAFPILSPADATDAAEPSVTLAVVKGGGKDKPADTDADGDVGDAPAAKSQKRGKSATQKAEEVSAEVVELTELLDQLQNEAVLQERSASTLAHELGLANRNVRGVDVGVAWVRQALEAVRRNAEKLHQTAGGTTPLPALSEANTGPNTPGSEPLGRMPTATRPLAEGMRLPAGVPIPGFSSLDELAAEQSAPADAPTEQPDDSDASDAEVSEDQGEGD